MARKRLGKLSVSRTSTTTTYKKPKATRQTSQKYLGAMGTVSDGVNQDTGGWLNGELSFLEASQDYELIVTTHSENTVGLDVYIGPGTMNGEKIGSVGTSLGKKDEVVNFSTDANLANTFTKLGFSDENYGSSGEMSLTVIDQVSLVKKSTGGPGTCSVGTHTDKTACEAAGETWTLDVPTGTDLISDGKFDWEYTYDPASFGSITCNTTADECTRLQALHAAGTTGELIDFIWDRISPPHRLDTKADYGNPASACLVPQFMWEASGRFRYLSKNVVPDTIEKIYLSEKDAEPLRYKNNACTPFHAEENQSLPCHGLTDYWAYSSTIDTAIMGITSTLNTSSTALTVNSDTPVKHNGRITITKPTKLLVKADLSGYNPYTTTTKVTPNSTPNMDFTTKDGRVTPERDLILGSKLLFDYLRAILATGHWNPTDLGAGRFRIANIDPVNLHKRQGEDWYNNKYGSDTFEEVSNSYYNGIHADIAAFQLVDVPCDSSTGIAPAGSHVSWEYLGELKDYGATLGVLNLETPGTYVIESEFRQIVSKGRTMETYIHPVLNQKLQYISTPSSIVPVPIKFELV